MPDFPDYHPEFPGGKPQGGHTLECPPFPYGELGTWRDWVGTSPYYPDFTIIISETTIGQSVPSPASSKVETRWIASAPPLGALANRSSIDASRLDETAQRFMVVGYRPGLTAGAR